MFGKKENGIKPAIVRSISSSTDVTYFAEDCEIKGSVTSKGNARIDGKIEGTVNVAGDLFVGESAVLKANIEALTIMIAGEVHGNVKAIELLELGASARLYGDIRTKQLKIEQGARFIGASTFEESATVSKLTPKEEPAKQ